MTAHNGKRFAIAVAAATLALMGGTAAAQIISPAPFTHAQSDAGRALYAASCASCHGDHLEGKGPPALAGKTFLEGPFGRRSVAQLYTYIQSSMPFCEGGSLAAESYLNIVAFLLEANGAKAGTVPLTPTAEVKVSDIITGEMPADFLKNAKAN